MTNRNDHMIDEALLRPGRLEVQIEIGKYTLVNVYVDLVVFTRIAGTS